MCTFIVMYICIPCDIIRTVGWHMHAWQWIPPVVVVYINIHGDTYLTISWHMKMPGDKPLKKLKKYMVITMYIHINGYKWITMCWHMHAWQWIPLVVIVYINIHGDTYLTVSWHMKMPSDKPPKTGKRQTSHSWN